MDMQTAELYLREFKWARVAGTAALGLLAAFLVVLTAGGLWELKYVGSGVPASNTITVSGEGEVFAVPDTATFSVTVRERAGEVRDAQETATEKANDIYEYLQDEGVEERDIKTTDYNVYPQYEWTRGACTSEFCPPGSKRELVGFEVSQTFSVKVRDTEQAGDLLSGVGGLGASEVSGLSFTIDDEDALKAEARDKAIAEAKEKAEELADQLGVRIVRVVGFYEEAGGRFPKYGRAMGGDFAMAVEEAMPAAAPSLPTGENKITSNVSITYEIR